LFFIAPIAKAEQNGPQDSATEKEEKDTDEAAKPVTEEKMTEATSPKEEKEVEVVSPKKDKVEKTDGTLVDVSNPSEMPDPQKINKITEPFVKASIMVPNDYVGAVMDLCQKKRGIFLNMEYIDDTRVNITYDIPLSEIVFDFFDQLKSNTKGYASFDYELTGYKDSNLVKMDILLNGEQVDALSFIVHREFAYQRGKVIVEKLKKLIPKQQFEIPIQAAIGNKIISRETIKAMRKNVLAKCYGGDISRKRKLLEKQKKGKERMKAVGSVEVPQDAFMAVLKMDEE